MLVLVSSREIASKLDQSMFYVEGSYEDGYIYDKNVFFMESIKEFCMVGDRSSIQDISFLFEELSLFEQSLGPHEDYAANIAQADKLLRKFDAAAKDSLMFGEKDTFIIEHCCIPLCYAISANLKAYYVCIRGMCDAKMREMHVEKFLDVLYSQKGVKHQYFLDHFTDL